MRELSIFCRIYCSENHREWAELPPDLENWMNKSICSLTGYSPSELMYGTERPNLFRKMLPKELWPSQEEWITARIHKAYLRMKKRALARGKHRKRGNAEWKRELNKKVLVKTQSISDALGGKNSKFLHFFQAPYWTSKVLGHSAYEIRDKTR